jgi:hypothetical protein
MLAAYAKCHGNFVLVASGSLEANGTKKLIEIVYDLLIEAIQLGSLALLELESAGAGGIGAEASAVATRGVAGLNSDLGS